MQQLGPASPLPLETHFLLGSRRHEPRQLTWDLQELLGLGHKRKLTLSAMPPLSTMRAQP